MLIHSCASCQHWHIDALGFRNALGYGVSGIGVPDDAHARVNGKAAFDLLFRKITAICEDNNAAVSRVSNADTAAIVNSDVRRPASRVE